MMHVSVPGRRGYWKCDDPLLRSSHVAPGKFLILAQGVRNAPVQRPSERASIPREALGLGPADGVPEHCGTVFQLELLADVGLVNIDRLGADVE